MKIELKDYEHLYIEYKNVELTIQALPPVDNDMRKEQYPRVLVVGNHTNTGSIMVEPPKYLVEDEEGVIFKRV